MVGVRGAAVQAGPDRLRKAIANRDLELAELGYERFQAAGGAERVLGYTLFAAQEGLHPRGGGPLPALREVLSNGTRATPPLEFRIIEAGELTMQRRATKRRSPRSRRS